jgi:hypothetical protein
LSLRELTMEQQQMQQQRMSTSAMPIYFVTWIWIYNYDTFRIRHVLRHQPT